MKDPNRYLKPDPLALPVTVLLAASVAMILVFGSGAEAAPKAPAASPAEIVRRVDDIRNPSESYSMKVQVTSADASDEPSAFEVFLKGNDKTLVKTTAPARDRGRNMLMLGEEMWAFVPNLKRSVRISLSQKLTGQAANGDISRMRWSGDYAPAIESEDAKSWQLLLTATKKGLTYEKVRAWVEKGTFRPLKAEFLTPAGKTLKKATYGGYKALAGKTRPTQIVIQDAVKESDASTIVIQSMQVARFPDSMFNQNSLK